MSVLITYYLDKNKDGDEVVCADWEWHGEDGKKDGKICATPDGATNPLSNTNTYVVIQLDGGAVIRDVSTLSSCKDLPPELRWKSPDGYSSFSQAFGLFKSRISGVASTPEPTAPEEVADPHAGQVYNPITEKWTWGF